MAPLHYAAKFDPFLSLDCAPRPPPWRNPRKGRDQILQSGNLEGQRQRGEQDQSAQRPQSPRERNRPQGSDSALVKMTSVSTVSILIR